MIPNKSPKQPGAFFFIAHMTFGVPQHRHFKGGSAEMSGVGFQETQKWRSVREIPRECTVRITPSFLHPLPSTPRFTCLINPHKGKNRGFSSDLLSAKKGPCLDNHHTSTWNQWSFLVPSIGGLYITYHLLWEPKITIDGGREGAKGTRRKLPWRYKRR